MPDFNKTQTNTNAGKKIYALSGLGADERVFQRLNFAHFSVVFLKWITPYHNESIAQYASRLCSQIDTPKPILLGLSFGGIMAIEIAKQIETEKVLLIATVKTQKEIPFYYRIAGKWRLHRLLPMSFLKHSGVLANWFFGAKSPFEKQLLKQILLDTDPFFLRWAIDKIVNWNNQKQLPNVFHIHGTSDRILPLHFVRCDVAIRGGGHFMTLNKAAELNEILRQNLL